MVQIYSTLLGTHIILNDFTNSQNPLRTWLYLNLNFECKVLDLHVCIIIEKEENKAILIDSFLPVQVNKSD